MTEHRIYRLPFSSVYPLYIAKAEKKGRTKEEVDEIIYWLTGYDKSSLRKQLDAEVTLKVFFDDAPEVNTKRSQITGVICGVRIEDIEDPFMREVRYLDKLIDELAKGRSMEKIKREV